MGTPCFQHDSYHPERIRVLDITDDRPIERAPHD